MTTRFKRITGAALLSLLLGLLSLYYLLPETTYRLLIQAERTSAGLELRRVRAASLEFAYLEGGRGEALVVLHGFGANKDHWTRIAQHLTPHFRLIAPDLPGFGETGPAPDGDYTIRRQVQRVNAFASALGISSFHLGGSSMGGHIAGAYAAAYPRKVKSLLLVAPGGVVSAESSDMQEWIVAGGGNPLVAQNLQDFRRTLGFLFHKKPFIPRPVQTVLLREAVRRRPMNLEIFKQIHHAWTDAPLERLLVGLPVATLIVWGARDRVLHVSGAGILETVMPQASVEVIAAVGHLPMIEKPRATAEAYLDFRAASGGGRS